MSLKSFHILFVTVSTLVCLGFAAWCFHSYSLGHSIVYCMAGIGSVVIAGGLVVYGKLFFDKMKRLHIS
jgi:hypothetical protein